MDISKISRSDDGVSRIGRFYNYNSGHFVLLTGYLKFDNEVYFEILDSNTWGKTLDGSIPAGKGRYIRSEELVNAAKTWWDDALRVDRPVSF